MDLRIKDLWIVKLNNGEYQQTKSALRTERGFCCLGVLCDLYSKEKNIPWKKITEKDFEIEKCGGLLPKEVMDWAGLNSDNPVIVPSDDSRDLGYDITLSGMNDRGSSFKEISEFIKKNL